jgi:hypothetical protein
MALEALRPSDHLLQRALVYRALLWQKQTPLMDCIITNSMHPIAHITHVYRTEPELRLAPRPLKEFQRCKD